MSLLRTAFESKDENIVWLTTLCSGCLAGVVERLHESGARHWARPLDGVGECEFCMEEVRQAL